MTREEILKLRPDFAELIARRPPLKPKKPAPSVGVPLGEKVAEVAKANPAGLEVRVTARSGDGTTYVDPPKRPTEIIQPLEVDEAGRVARARWIDCTTGASFACGISRWLSAGARSPARVRSDGRASEG